MRNWTRPTGRARRAGQVVALAAWLAACGSGGKTDEGEGAPLADTATTESAGDATGAAGAGADTNAGASDPAAPGPTPADPATGDAAGGGAGDAPQGTDPTAATPPSPSDARWGSDDWNGVGEPGTPASAGSLPAGTSCEEFAHVSHLPWDNRPVECPTGDFCLKWDGDPNEQFPNGPEDVIPGAKTWFSNAYAAAAGPIGGVAKIAIVTCKIGNQCLRFYGQDNCHYDLYDPDTNMTVKPPYVGGEQVPYSIKDGHDYLNFRVRLPGSDTIYNFTNVDATAGASPFYARYCPADASRTSAVATFDPVEGNQGLGCGPDSPYHPLAQLLGETRAPIPYEPPGRSEYDWTYMQSGPDDPNP